MVPASAIPASLCNGWEAIFDSIAYSRQMK
jgi:hypothetical protein